MTELVNIGMHKCHALVLVCSIVFITAYKLVVWHLFSGNPQLALECATAYGGIASGEWGEFIQTGEETCGQATLAFFLSGIGFPETEASIISETESTSMLSLADMDRVFTDRGLNTQLLNVGGEYFREHPTSSILHFSSRHFVVYMREENGEPVLFDPAYGKVFVSWKKLLRQFSGYMLYVYK
jgi:hypothetical protein